MPKITIDEKEFEFQQGQTVIEVARENGISIPHFCWHPELSISGNCRMCLVEIERIPKLAISCSTYATDGMVVHTQSEPTLAARKAVMEFILINHPLDCPICDEAGECKLQKYTFKHSTGESRFVEQKNSKPKRVAIGPHVMYDGERCISCSRCIRFSDEIAKKNQLTFTNRGDRVYITAFPGEELDNDYSMNTIDICPVGALTSRDFRFKARVWDMSPTESVCIGCSRGCNINMWVRNNEILRLTPRHNDDVNKCWMCDNGRLNSFKFVNETEKRIDGFFLRDNGNFTQVDSDKAIGKLFSRLKQFNQNKILLVGSPFATLEENYSLKKLAKELKSEAPVYLNHFSPGSGDDILVTEDKSPNRLGCELLGFEQLEPDELSAKIKEGNIKAVFILEEDILKIDSALSEKLQFIAISSPIKNNSTEAADVVLGSSSFAEKNGIFINVDGIAQRIRPAVTTVETDRALDGLSVSRLDKFGTEYDRWASGHKVNAKPHWYFIDELVSKMGKKSKHHLSEEIFEEIAENVDQFNGLDYDIVGGGGVKLNKVNSKLETT